MSASAATPRATRSRLLGIVAGVLPPVASRTTAAAAIGLAVAAIGGQLERASSAASAVDAASAWLRAPMFLVAVTAAVTTIEAWPGFGRDRSAAAAWVHRARLRPLRGTAVAAATALAATAIALAVTGFLFAAIVDPGPERRLKAVDVLGGTIPRVLGAATAARFDLPPDLAERPTVTLEVRAKPAFVPGQSLTAPALEARAAGVQIGRIEFPHGFGVGRLAVPRDSGSPLELRVASGDAGFLVLGPNAVRLTHDSERSPRANAVLAALTAVIPAAAALGLAVLLHAAVGRTTLLVVAVGVMLLGFAAGSPGVPDALAAHSRAEEVRLPGFSATRAPEQARG
ncbi:MAG: hypothetical protein O3C51_01425 [Planctomycetota bacterium]|nr:hypothetical protein [Planctomycetota bacterium]